MKHITLVVADTHSLPDLFGKLQSFYACDVLDIEAAGRLDFRKSALVLVDFAGASGRDLALLKRALEQNVSILKIGCVAISDRREVVQARAVGLAELWDREVSIDDAVETIRQLIGNYASPALPKTTPQATRAAVGAFCQTYDDLTNRVVTRRPFQVEKVARTVNGIVKALHSDGLDTWLAAVQNHHSHTYCHSMMVTGLAVAFGEALGYSEDDRSVLSIGALVHDLGKIQIPLSILDKPSELTKQEAELIRKHPEYSRAILSRRPEIAPQIKRMAVQHHEFLDGSGYPEGLAGDEIEEMVRVVTICDIYAALTEQRPYKECYAPRQAFAIMLAMGGKLDQTILRKFKPLILDADVGALKRAGEGFASARA